MRKEGYTGQRGFYHDEMDALRAQVRQSIRCSASVEQANDVRVIQRRQRLPLLAKTLDDKI
jgi:hypothetical protein